MAGRIGLSARRSRALFKGRFVAGYWFQFRIWDFERSCDRVGMSPAEKWAYTRIIGMWNDGAEDRVTYVLLQKWSQTSRRTWPRFWHKLSILLTEVDGPNGPLYYHPSALEGLAESRDLKEKRQFAATKSHEARRSNKIANIASATVADPNSKIASAKIVAIADSRHRLKEEKTTTESVSQRDPGENSERSTPVKVGGGFNQNSDQGVEGQDGESEDIAAVVECFLTTRRKLWPNDDGSKSGSQITLETETSALLAQPGATASIVKAAISRCLKGDSAKSGDFPYTIGKYHLSLPSMIKKIINEGLSSDEGPTDAERKLYRDKQLKKDKALFVKAYGKCEGGKQMAQFQSFTADRMLHQATGLMVKAKLAIAEKVEP